MWKYSKIIINAYFEKKNALLKFKIFFFLNSIMCVNDKKISLTNLPIMTFSVIKNLTKKITFFFMKKYNIKINTKLIKLLYSFWKTATLNYLKLCCFIIIEYQNVKVIIALFIFECF